MRKNALVAGGVIFSFAAGTIIGYALARRELEIQYQERSDEEINEARKYYARFYKKEEFASAEDAAAALLPKRNPGETIPEDQKNEPDLEYKPADADILDRVAKGLKYKVDHETVEMSVLAEDQPYDWEQERAERHEDQPYLISLEEFKLGEKNYTQPDLTWFEGDQVLMIDLSGDKVDDVDEIVGLANLQRFGHMSNDSDTVYVRNDLEQKDFMITRDEGSYSEKVAPTGSAQNARQRHQSRRRG